MQHHTDTEPRDRFPTDSTGLPEARATELVELSHGEHLDLRIAPVAKRLGDATVRMLAYNGSIPGPILKVQEGSEVIVDVENQGDTDATVHWHGLRLENRYDGTHETQRPMAVGERFSRRSPCQWTVASMSPWFSTSTMTSEPSCTFNVGPGIDPL